MKIEPVEVHEAAAVLEFVRHVVAISVDAPAESKVAFVENLQLNIARWAKAPERSVHLKIVESENIIGVILVRDYQNLCSLFVAPAHHRRGIGSALVREAILQCSRKAVAPTIRLNAAFNAVPFYVALGFHEVLGLRPVVSAVPMELAL